MSDTIKKIKKRIYEFDFSNAELKDGTEIMTEETVSEFVNTFKKRDMDEGIMVTPYGYTRGLFYRSSNGGEIYNSPKYLPDIVTFSLDVFGLKRNAFYKITIVGRDTGSTKIITDDRTIRVSNEEKELLIDEDLKGVDKNTEYHSIFRSTDNETNLYFRLGKIFLNNIIIDEIELIEEDFQDSSEITDSEIGPGKLGVVSFGVFTTETINEEAYKGRYIPVNKYIGRGLNLYFDTLNMQYVLERDNVNDTIGESFTNSNFIVDFNFNKVVNKGQFSQYNICEVSPDISPNTLKSGFIRFEFVDADDNVVQYTGSDSRMSIVIHKIY